MFVMSVLTPTSDNTHVCDVRVDYHPFSFLSCHVYFIFLSSFYVLRPRLQVSLDCPFMITSSVFSKVVYNIAYTILVRKKYQLLELHATTKKLCSCILKTKPQVIKFTSCLPMVGGSLRVLRLLPSLKLVPTM